MSSRLLFVLAVPWLVPTPLLSLQVSVAGAVTPGATIRVVAPTVAPAPLTATVLVAGPDTLLVKVAGEAAGLVLPLDGVQRLQIYRGRRSDPGAAVGGAVLGLAVGAGAGWLLGPSLCDPNDDLGKTFCYSTAQRERTFAAILFGVAGAIGGGVVAGHPRDRWESIALERLKIAPGPGGGLSLSLSVTH